MLILREQRLNFGRYYKVLLIVRDRYSIVERFLRINFLRCQNEKITILSSRI